MPRFNTFIHKKMQKTVDGIRKEMKDIHKKVKGAKNGKNT